MQGNYKKFRICTFREVFLLPNKESSNTITEISEFYQSATKQDDYREFRVSIDTKNPRSTGRPL
jgi:hypothetical protein